MSTNREKQITNVTINDVKYPIRTDTRIYLSDFIESNSDTIDSSTLGQALSVATAGKTLVITPYINANGKKGNWKLKGETFDLTYYANYDTVEIIGEDNPVLYIDTATTFKIPDGFRMREISFTATHDQKTRFILAEGGSAYFDNVKLISSTSVVACCGVGFTNSGHIYFNNCDGFYAVNSAVDTGDFTTEPNCIAYYNGCVMPSSSTTDIRIGGGCINYMVACRLYHRYYYGAIYATGCYMNGVYSFNGGELGATLLPMHFTGCDITGLGTVNLGNKANVIFTGCIINHGGTPAFTVGTSSAVLLEGCKVGCSSSLLTSLTGVTLGHCMFLDGVYPKTS